MRLVWARRYPMQREASRARQHAPAVPHSSGHRDRIRERFAPSSARHDERSWLASLLDGGSPAPETPAPPYGRGLRLVCSASGSLASSALPPAECRAPPVAFSLSDG